MEPVRTTTAGGSTGGSGDTQAWLGAGGPAVVLHAVEVSLRERLELRRERLAEALDERRAAPAELEGLLGEVDRALDRLAAGKFGICEECGDPVEVERIVSDPLIRVCLDHLSAPERRALEHDLETAARVQAALLPAADQTVHGWEIHLDYLPAGPVSGDFCVLVPDGERGGLHVLFGDAIGKGVAASLLMSQLHALFRVLVSSPRAPEDLVAELNRLLRESTPAGRFATLVYARLSGTGEVELVNAGHLPPLVVRAGGVERLPSDGMPVGLFDGLSFSSQRLSLAAGETLVLYTDGITEATDGSGREFGVDRFAAAFEAAGTAGARDLAARPLRDLASFRGRGKGDDLSLLALRRSGGSRAD